MPTFLDIAGFVKEFDTVQTLSKIFSSQNIQKWVLDTIRNRIDLSGVTGSEQTLKTDKSGSGNPYSDFTMDIYDWMGLQTNHVDLKVSGDFHASFRFVLNLFGWEITADFQKEDGHIAKNFTNMYSSQEDFESDVLSLTAQEIDSLIKNQVTPLYLKEYHETVYRS